MACNCLKEFKYNISYKTCKEIHYQDVSTWVEVPEEYEITITTPVGAPKVVTVTTNGITVITPETLELSTTNFPAGVYCIQVTNCNGDVITKNFLSLCVLECELASALALIDFSKCNDDIKEELERYDFIFHLLQGAKAKFECDWCSINEVKEIIVRIKELLAGLNCECHG